MFLLFSALFIVININLKL